MIFLMLVLTPKENLIINADERQNANSGGTRRNLPGLESNLLRTDEELDSLAEDVITSSFFSITETASVSTGVKNDVTDRREVLSGVEEAKPKTGSQYIPHTTSKRDKAFNKDF